MNTLICHIFNDNRRNNDPLRKAIYHFFYTIFVILCFFSSENTFSATVNFHSDTGRFSATLPKNPTLSVQLLNKEHNINLYSYNIEMPDYMLGISYLDFPKAGRIPETDDDLRDFYTKTRDGGLQGSHTQLLRQQYINFQGQLALEYWSGDSLGIIEMRTRLIYFKRRNYTIIIAYPKGNELPPAGLTTLESFRMW